MSRPTFHPGVYRFTADRLAWVSAQRGKAEAVVAAAREYAKDPRTVSDAEDVVAFLRSMERDLDGGFVLVPVGVTFTSGPDRVALTPENAVTVEPAPSPEAHP